VLISPWLDAIGDMIFDASDPADDLPYVNYLPEYATIAWHHHRIGGGLQRKSLEEVYAAAEAYAKNDYIDALSLGAELPDGQRSKVLKKLGEFTGLSKADLEANGIRIDLDHFRNGVLKDQGQVVAYYDGRMSGKVVDPVKNDPYDAFDPIFTAGMKTYFGGTLGISSDLPYQDMYDPPSWPGANPAGAIEGGYLNVMGDLNTLLSRNPSMKFYIASGLFDLVCPAAEVHFMVSHLKPAVARRIEIGHYPAGHPIYFGQESAAKFAAEMATFLKVRFPLP
jgi:carboxypeptidase C (cathepsin A)